MNSKKYLCLKSQSDRSCDLSHENNGKNINHNILMDCDHNSLKSKDQPNNSENPIE